MFSWRLPSNVHTDARVPLLTKTFYVAAVVWQPQPNRSPTAAHLCRSGNLSRRCLNLRSVCTSQMMQLRRDKSARVVSFLQVTEIKLFTVHVDLRKHLSLRDVVFFLAFAFHRSNIFTAAATAGLSFGVHARSPMPNNRLKNTTIVSIFLFYSSSSATICPR